MKGGTLLHSVFCGLFHKNLLSVDDIQTLCHAAYLLTHDVEDAGIGLLFCIDIVDGVAVCAVMLGIVGDACNHTLVQFVHL